MNNIITPGFIESLYNDHRILEHQPSVTGSYREKMSLLTKSGNAFQDTLTPEQEELFEAYGHAMAAVQDAILLDRFTLGFRLGGQCVCEVLLNPDNPLATQ